jgi:glycosyltransferase involved in cell wall biosynthesis
MPKLSAVIITLNEERNIGRCIDSIKEIADDIVVVDSGSTDQTEAICAEKGARFFVHTWEGYIEQKNYANTLAEYPLILSIDADEAVSEALKGSIRKVKGDPQADGYEMNRMTNYCGKWIRHSGWYPDSKLRLFHRDKIEWGGERIHESMVFKLPGVKIEKIHGDLFHYSYYTISEHITQANHFTNMTAELAVEKGRKAGLFKLIFSPWIKFIRDYFIKSGFRDGYYGYIICRISAQATFMKYAKISQLRKGETRN